MKYRVTILMLLSKIGDHAIVLQNVIKSGSVTVTDSNYDHLKAAFEIMDTLMQELAPVKEEDLGEFLPVDLGNISCIAERKEKGSIFTALIRKILKPGARKEQLEQIKEICISLYNPVNLARRRADQIPEASLGYHARMDLADVRRLLEEISSKVHEISELAEPNRIKRR